MKIRKILAVFYILFFTITIVTFGKTYIPKPNYDFYVYDEVGVLDRATKNYIIEINEKLNKATGAQIVIVIVEELEGIDIESYSLELFRSWGIGSKEKNNGLLLIASIKDRGLRLEVGYGLEGAIPDGKAGRLLDEYVIPHFKEGNYGYGILEGFKACLSLVQDEYMVKIDQEITSEKYYINDEVVVNGIFTFIMVFILLILIAIDIFFNRALFTKVLLNIAIHSSKGGHSGGGNFGGGGSSGGGGASRKW